MIAQTTRDILDRARYFHHQLQLFYEGLKDRMEERKLHLVLDYLAQHESRMEEAIKDYEEAVSEQVAATCISFSPKQTIEDVISAVKVPEKPTLYDLMRIAIHLEDCFVNLYHHAAEQIDFPEIRELFERLEEETVKDREKLASDLMNMHDLM